MLKILKERKKKKNYLKIAFRCCLGTNVIKYMKKKKIFHLKEENHKKIKKNWKWKKKLTLFFILVINHRLVHHTQQKKKSNLCAMIWDVCLYFYAVYMCFFYVDLNINNIICWLYNLALYVDFFFLYNPQLYRYNRHDRYLLLCRYFHFHFFFFRVFLFIHEKLYAHILYKIMLCKKNSYK